MNVSQKFATLVSHVHGEKTGLFFHDLCDFFGSSLKISKGGIATVPVKIPVKDLGGKTNDLRALLYPTCHENDLVPMLVFVDKKALAAWIETLPASTP